MKKTVMLLIILSISGCTTLKPEAVVTPSEISVQDAMKSVADGLSVLKDSLDKNKMKTGLYVDQVDLNLQLTSKATDTKTLAVDITQPVLSGKVIGLNSSEYAEGSRGSTLKVTLKNKVTSDKDKEGFKDIQVFTVPVSSENIRPRPDLLFEH